MAFPQDHSWGRIPNGTGPFVIMTTPTPGAENQVGTPGGDTLQAPIFSHDSGFYTTGFTLTLSTNEPGATIIYTLDGSEPSAQNIGGKTYNYKNQYPQNPGDPVGPMLFNSFETLEYSAPVSIVDRTAQPNKISNISSTYDANIPNYFPSSNLYKTNVVRAKVVKPGFTDSPIITKNYFVTPEGSGLYNIPVVSLSIDEDKLFDYGIYVAGKLFDDYRAANPSLNIDWPVGNYTQKGSGFERVANFNYFVGGQEVINQRVGIRVQGNYSRLYPLKSFNFYSRADLGAGTLPYKFFNDVDDNFLYRFCLKNNGSDMGNTVFRDPLVNMLTRSMNTQTEAYQPVVAFINGEFWGMMAIREKYDDKFFNRTHGIPENEIQLLENDGYQIEEGNSNAHYLAMFDFVENNPMSVQANYDYIKTQMDPDSFVDYFIQNIF
ncbi:MAG TPA: CotH kinase family protein, partial [Flavobacterium sp.]|nr:CotH kinase family protein [Flavobacterium sp.]